jgi:predicted AlkP superfamily phosphohydrolase/phosphomutase/tetratricopeptide (TPR) repeat protein
MSRKVLLVGWDAADWKVAMPLVEAGAMPNLARIMREGVSGNIATLHPPLSPMLWTSIATGKRPPKHGIFGFSEVTPDGKSIRPITIEGRRTKAIWNILNQHSKRSVVVGWWPSHPAEPINGAIVSDWFRDLESENLEQKPVAPGSVHPPELAPLLRDLRVSPYEITGEMLRAFVPDFNEVDQTTDKSLHSLAKLICEGMTTNAVATELLETQDWDFGAIYFDTLDHFGHTFMAYHPPHTSRANEKIAELYRHCVSNAYAWHDAMLGELIAAAGPEATVILTSDHGFHSDHLRPDYIPAEAAGPAIEHRHYGILAMCGPGIKKSGGSIYGAVLTDLCPTILRLFDLPAGDDMDGKVLASAIDQSLEPIKPIASWDLEEGPLPDGRHPNDRQFDTYEAVELRKRLEDLGYLDHVGDNMELAISNTIKELKYNEARAQMEALNIEKAAELFDELHSNNPLELRFVQHLVDALLAQDKHDKARQLLENFGNTLDQEVPKAIETLKEQQEKSKTLRNEYLELWKQQHANPDTTAQEDTQDFKPGVQLTDQQIKEMNRKEFLKVLKTANNEEEALLLINDESDIWKINQDNRRLSELASGYHEPRALMQARILLHASAPQTDDDKALARLALEFVNEAQGEMPRGLVELAQLWLALGEYQTALEMCERLLNFDQEDWRALSIKAEISLITGNTSATIESGLDSIALVWHQPAMHMLVGLALERLSEPEKAIRMLENALGMTPTLVRAHAALGRIYARPPMSQPVLANRHRETVANLLSRLTRLNLAWQQTLEETLRRDAAMAAEAY